MSTTTRHLLRRDLADLLRAQLPGVEVFDVPPGQAMADEMIVLGLTTGTITYPAFAAATTLIRDDTYRVDVFVTTHEAGRDLDVTIDRTVDLIASVEQTCIDVKVTPSLVTSNVEMLSLLVVEIEGPHAEPHPSGTGWVGFARVVVEAHSRQS